MTDSDAVSVELNQGSDSNPELREVKLTGVNPGKKVEITFDIKPIEKPKKPDSPKKPDPPKKEPPKKSKLSGWNQIGLVALLLLLLIVAVNSYFDIRIKLREDLPDLWNPSPHPYKPYCPQPDPYSQPCRL